MCMCIYIYIYTTKQAIQAWSKAILPSGFFWRKTSPQTWLHKPTGKSPSSGLLQVRKICMEDVLYQHGAAWYEASLQSSKRNATPQKENTTCLKLIRLVDWFRTLLFAFMFPFSVATNPFVCQLPWNTKAANPPTLQLNPIFIPPEFPSKSILFAHHQGAIRTTWVRSFLGVGDAMPILVEIPSGFVWCYGTTQYILTRKTARPSTKKISCKHKSQAKKSLVQGI